MTRKSTRQGAFCSACGTAVAAGDQFCRSCGQALQLPPSLQRVAPRKRSFQRTMGIGALVLIGGCVVLRLISGALDSPTDQNDDPARNVAQSRATTTPRPARRTAAPAAPTPTRAAATKTPIAATIAARRTPTPRPSPTAGPRPSPSAVATRVNPLVASRLAQTRVALDRATAAGNQPSRTPTPPAASDDQRRGSGEQDLAQESDDSFDSGGLGLSFEQFEALHGSGEDGDIGVTHEVANGRIISRTFTSGRVAGLSRYFDTGVSVDEARAVGLSLAPADAVLVETYVTSFGSIADLYYSESLKARFPDTMTIGEAEYTTWINGEPGNFIIGYGGYDPVERPEVTRIVMGLGNNP